MPTVKSRPHVTPDPAVLGVLLDVVEDRLLALRRRWGLSLPELCQLRLAVLGAPDRFVAFSTHRTSASVRRIWSSILAKARAGSRARIILDIWCDALTTRATWQSENPGAWLRVGALPANEQIP